MMIPTEVATITTIVRDCLVSAGIVIGLGYLVKFSYQYGQAKQYFLDLLTEGRAWGNTLLNNHMSHLQKSSDDMVVALKQHDTNETAQHEEMIRGIDALRNRQAEKQQDETH
jgi:hypothetical protein